MITVGTESCESNDLSVIIPWLLDKARFTKNVTTDNLDLEQSEEWTKIRDSMLASMNDPEVKNYQIRGIKEAAGNG